MRPNITGNYMLYIKSDDGSRVRLDGVVLIDNGGAHGPLEKSATVTLTAGVWYTLWWVQRAA